MPIRINLLAEAQALEELRRRDPVKRAVLAGIVLALLLLGYSSSVQLKSMLARSELSRIESELAAHTNEYQTVLESQRKLAEFSRKAVALQQLATNRLLYGNILNALQKAAMPEVQLVRLRADQSYVYTAEVKPKTNANNRVVPGKPATLTERILLTLEARDNGQNAGDQVSVFKERISVSPYFQRSTGLSNEVRLASLAPPQPGPDNKPFVLFTLECRYPEVTR
jgi:hypothetical protein